MDKIEITTRDELRFEDVGVGCFFICDTGELCQKADNESYTLICDVEGNPRGRWCKTFVEMPITKIIKVGVINYS